MVIMDIGYSGRPKAAMRGKFDNNPLLDSLLTTVELKMKILSSRWLHILPTVTFSLFI